MGAQAQENIAWIACGNLVNQPVSFALAEMANSTECSELRCARCHCVGHFARNCSLPFLRTITPADQRAEAAKRRVEWGKRQEEKAQKVVEWEAKQAEWAARKASFEARRSVRNTTEKDCDAESTSTVATTTPIAVDEVDIERMVLVNKDVRKFMKVLREIEKLERCSDLDELQKAKIARRPEVELELDGAKGLARVRAQDTQRRQVCA